MIDQKTVPLEEGLILATPEECFALASRFNIKSINLLRVDFTVETSTEKGTYWVKGTLKASVVQSCITTFEDLTESIEETFSVVLYEPDWAERIDSLDIDDDRDFEALISGRVDLGELAAQYLALALNPYPRKEG